MYLPMKNSKTKNIKWQYYEKQYYNKIEIRKYMNNKYYDVCYFFFVKPLFAQGYYFIEPQNRELSGEINVKICIIEKIKKIQSKKL